MNGRYVGLGVQKSADVTIQGFTSGSSTAITLGTVHIFFPVSLLFPFPPPSLFFNISFIVPTKSRK